VQNSKLQNCRLFFCLGGQFFFATRWKEAPCSACLFCGCTRATFSDDCTCWRNGIILCCVLHFAGTEKNVISASHTIQDSERGFLFHSAFVLVAHATPHYGTSIISYLAPDKCAFEPSRHCFFLSGLALLVAIFLWEDQPNQGTKFNRIAIAMNYFLISHQFCIYSLNLLRERENDTDPVNLQVVFAGDKVPHDNRVLISCNHRTEVDWMYIWDLAIRKGKIGYCKYAVKSSVRNVPIFGWAFWVFEFLMLERKWDVDKPVIESYLKNFMDPADPLWLVIFPEGTDFT